MAHELRRFLVQGLGAVREEVQRRGFEHLATLSPGDRREALDSVATSQPAFLPGLIFQTYAGYYQHPAVLEGLGLEPRPPHPKGYVLEPSDASLLDPVRARPGLYRDVGDG